MSFDLNECAQDCFECIKAYKKKHRLSGLEENPFRISCGGIPKQYITEDLYSVLPAEQVKTAEIMLDPVAWAREVLDWHCLDPDGEVWKRKNPKEYYDWIKKHPGEDILGHSRYHRPYQALMLRCLHEDSNVFMADGTVKKIKDVKVDDKVITYNEGRKTIQSSYRVLNKWFNGYRDTYELHLENGDILKVTDNHPILSWFKDGNENPLFKCKAFKRVYKSLSDGIDVGTKIYTLNKFDLFGQIDDDDLAKILGYIVTDGYVRNTGLVGEKHVLSFANIRPKLVLEFRKLLMDRFNIDAPIKYHPERIDEEGVVHKKHWTVSVFNKDSSILSFLREIGCIDKTNREMSILNYSFLFSKKSLSYFINRCWSGDGCVYSSTRGRDEDLPLVASLTLSSGNLEFLNLYRLLLKKIGIYASHIYKNIKPDGAISLTLNIGRISDVEIFFDFCGPVFGKEEQSKIALFETSKRRHYRRCGNMKTLSRTKIVDIKYLGLQPVYDIEVDVRHNFVTDGVVVHNCSSQYKAFRIGRRAGKCLVSGSLVQMADGGLKPIESIKDGDLVLSLNKGYEFVSNPAYCSTNGVKPVYLLKLADGREIKATNNHPFLTRRRMRRQTWSEARAEGRKERRYGIYEDKWIELKDLTKQHYVAVPVNNSLSLSKRLDNRYMTILGCMIADGNLTSGNCRFSNNSEEIVERLRDALLLFDGYLKQYESDDDEITYHLMGSGVGKKSNIRDWFREIGLWGLDSHEKYIPDEFMTLCDENTVELLRCLYGCDGWASVDQNQSVQIGYSTASERLAAQIVSLLSRFGIYTDVRDKKVKLDGKIYWSKQLCISRKDSVERFRNNIGILSKDRSVEDVYLTSSLKGKSNRTEAYSEDNVVFIQVKNISYIGDEMTWNLSVPENPNFIANNIVTHNTETLVISILYNMFVKPGIPEGEGFKSIVIAPYQEQIDGIFKRIDQLINLNTSTSNAIKRYVKSPSYRLELHNDSMVKGLTAGTKSGGNAASVRGSDAHQLVFDETDYLSQADINAALAVTIDHPNATVWMSSTPSGARSKFYENCNSRLYKEFHFSSSVNPMWNKETEVFFREGLTEIAYNHEILAAWGEQEEGVFQNVYVEAAQDDFEYKSLPRDPNWRYTLGVDWNDVKIGTSIVVLGFNPAVQRFYLVDKQKVSRDGWNQTAACRKIVELNQFWRPEWIYVDTGHGSTQIEMLRLLGWESLQKNGTGHPDSRLKDIVKGYSFGSTVEIFDLVTKQPIKKPAKPFLVENTVRKFEHGVFSYPKSDDLLTKQLNGYIVDHTTTSGVPIYKASDETVGDHDLDALMLAFVAFTLETTDFGRPKFSIDFAFSGKIGEKMTPTEMPGFIVVKSDRKVDERANNRPEMNRTDGVSQENKVLLTREATLPGRHLNSRSDSVRLWSWSESERKNTTRSSVGLSIRTNRPVRKNI